MKNFCFMVKDNPNIRNTDFKELFGDWDGNTFDDEIIWLESNSTMADVVVASGVYPTKSKAKNDGWNKPIPIGWWDKEVGKRRTRISIWNPSE